MTISMYSASVPVFQRMLRNLSHILDKAAAFCEARKVDPSVLTRDRLAPDMLPLTRQVFIATDAAKLAVSRITGMEAPKFEDDDSYGFAQLKERIQKTLDFLASVKPEALDGTDEKQLSIPVGGSPVQMSAEDYLKYRALPNFFFHVTTAYSILRHNGVELGKADYLAGART